MSLSRLFRRTPQSPSHESPVLESATIFLSKVYQAIVVKPVWSKPKIFEHKAQAPEVHFVLGENWLRCQPWVNIYNSSYYRLDNDEIAMCGLKLNFGGKYGNSHRCFLPLSTEQYNSDVNVTIETNYLRTINERGIHYYTEKSLRICVKDIPLETVLRNHVAALAKRANDPATSYYEQRICHAHQTNTENFLNFYLAQQISRTLMTEPGEIEEVAKLFVEELGSSFSMYPFD